MRLVAILSALSWFGPAASAQQPFINYRGAVNAASYLGQGLPGGSIAQGSIFAIPGSNLGPAQAVENLSYPLPSQVAGVSVDVVQNATAVSAIPLYVQAAEVLAIMPSNAPLGTVSIRVHVNNQTSNPAYVTVVGASPGLFSLAGTGFGPGAAQNFVSSTNQPVNTLLSSVPPGQTMTLWATGLGPVPYADNVVPTPGNLPTGVEVFVGNQSAQVISSGRSACCAGLDEIVFTVPPKAPTGCYVPVQVRANGTVVSNAVTIAVGNTGAPCADSFNPAGTAVRSGGRNGFVQAERADYLADVGPNAPGEVTEDFLSADLRQDTGGPTYFSPEYSLPPIGTCTMYSGQAYDAAASTVRFAPQSRALDGGLALQVAAGGAMASVSRVPGAPPFYGALLGEQPTLDGTPGLFFNFPGAFTLTIPGGADVQQAQAAGTTPAPLQWSNRSSLSTLVRANGLTVNWTGGNPATDVAVIAVLANNDAANSAALAWCVAPIAAGTFSLPPEILQSLPATPASAQRIPAWVIVGSESILNPSTFSAPGLKEGYLLPGYLAVKSVLVN